MKKEILELILYALVGTGIFICILLFSDLIKAFLL